MLFRASLFVSIAVAVAAAELQEAIHITHYAPHGTKCAGDPFVVIQQPLHKRGSVDHHNCLTTNGFKHYTWELLPNSPRNAHYQCVYADTQDSSRTGGDSSCVVETHADCTIANHDLDVCFLALASITGLQVNDHNVSTRAEVKPAKYITPQTNSPKVFHRKEWQGSTDCGATDDDKFLVLNMGGDDCVFNMGATGVGGHVFIKFDNRYDVASRTAQFCIHHDDGCVKTPFQCREYELDKCEHDGRMSQTITLEAYVTASHDSNLNPTTTAPPETSSASSFAVSVVGVTLAALATFF